MRHPVYFVEKFSKLVGLKAAVGFEGLEALSECHSMYRGVVK
jgi:hypothetical protein